MKRVKLAIGAAVAVGLGSIAATIWVGASVREDTVVEKPYEEGLRQDAERAARGALGLSVAVEDEAPRAGTGPLLFRLSDRQGRAAEAARVAVELSRPETSRGEVRAEARPLAPGRWVADVAFPAPGPWDVRFDVVRGADRVRLERRLVASARCELGAGPCSGRLAGGGEVTLELGPRPIRAMRELAVRVTVSTPPAPPITPAPPPAPPTVSVSFSMPGMEMGENRVSLAPAAPATWAGKAVLVRCPSGKRDWVVEVSVAERGGAARTARFPLAVPEER